MHPLELDVFRRICHLYFEGLRNASGLPVVALISPSDAAPESEGCVTSMLTNMEGNSILNYDSTVDYTATAKQLCSICGGIAYPNSL